MFMLNVRAAKSLKGEQLDEEIFRTYFKKLYKTIVKMEAQFMEILSSQPGGVDSFVCYSKSVKDIAEFFKIDRDPTEYDINYRDDK